MGHALSRRHTQQPCVSTVEGGGLVSWWVLVGFALSSPVSWRALAGVILFVFRLDALVVCLKGCHVLVRLLSSGVCAVLHVHTDITFGKARMV